ncbi:hypothetical protein B0J18DRAFT_148506 [Chaetomium sp. MPI-SDFR-AT-0129]|nr:hypothetical protein B0J18DRAFT_148506 [Chaetomium sp. MPI-SDFR-AT-0129]
MTRTFCCWRSGVVCAGPLPHESPSGPSSTPSESFLHQMATCSTPATHSTRGPAAQPLRGWNWLGAIDIDIGSRQPQTAYRLDFGDSVAGDARRFLALRLWSVFGPLPDEAQRMFNAWTLQQPTQRARLRFCSGGTGFACGPRIILLCPLRVTPSVPSSGRLVGEGKRWANTRDQVFAEFRARRKKTRRTGRSPDRVKRFRPE